MSKKEPTANQLLDAVDDARDRLAEALRLRALYIVAWVSFALVFGLGAVLLVMFGPDDNTGGGGVVAMVVSAVGAFILGCMWSDNMAGIIANRRRAVKAAERAHRDFEGPW